jgi:hypothetical protein
MRRDPFENVDRLIQVVAVEYFTDREGAIEAFERYLNAPAGTDLRVLTFYGVGGIGKTTLMNKLCDNLRHDKIPHARFDMQTIRDQTQAYREALLQMRCDLRLPISGQPQRRLDGSKIRPKLRHLRLKLAVRSSDKIASHRQTSNLEFGARG